MAITPSTVEASLIKWAKAVAPSLTWIISHQADARVPRPYGMVTHLSETNEGQAEQEYTDSPSGDEFEFYSHRPKRGTFRLSIYADDHADRILDIEAAVDDGDGDSVEFDDDLHVRGVIASYTHNRVARNTEFEHFSTLDLEYSRTHTRGRTGPALESVDVDGTLDYG